MKIDNSRLNSLYDQYSNDENRLTHALLHTIGSSDWIFIRFLKNFIGIKPFYKSGIFEISTQKVPFNHGDDNKQKVQSVPDAWIINETANLGIAIEVKDRKKNIRLSQLKSHINRIKGYEHPYLVVITPDIHMPKKINEIDETEYPNLKKIWKSWDKIYWWLKDLSNMQLPKNGRDEFLILSMLEYLERRREVLGFQGISFKRFNVEDAKLILKSEMDELQPYVKNLYKELVARRPAVTTTSVVSVWDCFGSASGFTTDIHISMSINEESHNIAMVVPNASRKAWNRLKEIFSIDENKSELISILAKLRKSVPYLYIEFVQRHFITQKKGIQDGHLFFNLDAIGEPFLQEGSKTKQSPIWFQAIQEAITNKRKLNGQVAFIARFFLIETEGIKRPEFLNTVKTTLQNFKPLYDFLKSD